MSRSGGTGDDQGRLALLALAASQTVLLTAVLSYFGWARANATLAHFGLDPGLVGYDDGDLVLRSISVAFPGAVGAAVGGLVLLLVHRSVVAPALTGPRNGRARRLVIGALRGMQLAVGTAIGLLVGAAAWPGPVGGRLGIGVPLLVAAVAAASGYLGYVRGRFPRVLPGRGRPVDRGQARLRLGLLTALGLLGAFWAAGLAADDAGKVLARRIADGTAPRPSVVVHSEQRLQLTAPGVAVDPIGGDGDRYRFRYSGLRLLARSGDTLWLLPAGWAPGGQPVFAVPDDGTVRMDVLSAARR